MGCWKWFNSVLKEAEVQVTEQNKSKIDDAIHKYISEQASYGRCSAGWKKARKEINENPRNETRTHTKAQNESLTNIGSPNF